MARKPKHQRMSCPKCGGNSYVYTHDIEFGYCFLCTYKEYKGNVTHQEKVRSEYVDEIRNYYKQLAHYYHKSLTKQALTFLHQRGFTNDTIERFLIGYCPQESSPLYRDQIAVEAGIGLPHDSTSVLAGRITFPYFFNDDTIVDIRGRSLDPDEAIKYKSPYHSSYYRAADYLYNNHLSNADTIIVTEGEIKADISTQSGFTTLAMPGINSIKKFLQRENQKVIIVFDSQRKNQQFVNQAIKKVSKEFNDPYIGTLPLLNKDKQDIDGFILAYGIQMYADVIYNALPYQTWKTLTERF